MAPSSKGKQKAQDQSWAFLIRNDNSAYGQRFAASSQPAARAGGAVDAATTGAGIRIGCWGGVDVKVGFTVSVVGSFSSESNGAATRNASTSFSNLVSSSSFCLKTSYTFFMLRHL
ncbi:MAG: hypothetical protein LAO22_05880 [Acidobacteriia bacterium]|nr:hypothetical protein [Terriglobia bacterium]